MKRGVPSTVHKTLGRLAAVQFHALATSALVEANKLATASEIARIVGEPRQCYSGYRTGYRPITLDHVACWLARWETAGHPGFVITIDSATIVVHRKG